MEENNSYKQLDEIMRSKMQGAEDPPSTDVWNDIEKRLDDTNKRPGFIYWLSGIALLFIAAGAIWYFTQHTNLNSSITSVDQNGAMRILHSKNNIQDSLKNTTSGTGRNDAVNNKNTIGTIHDNNKDETGVSKQVNKAVAANENSDNVKPGKSEPLKQTIENAKTQKKVDENPVEAITTDKSSVKKRGTSTNKNFRVKENSDLETNATGGQNDKTKIKANNEKSDKADLLLVSDKKIKKTEKKDDQQSAYASGNNTSQSNVPEKDSIKNIVFDAKKITTGDSDKKTDINKTEKLKKAVTDSSAQVIVKKESSDSTVTAKKDTVKALAANPLVSPKSDSIKPQTEIPLFSRMLSVYFSPDYYQNLIKDNSGQDIKDEIRTLTYTEGIKFTYVMKDKLSVRIGVSYSELQQQFEEHLIYFDRHITEPFVFHSSLGDMAVDPATMLEGFSSMAPPSITQFRFNYTYSQKAQFINIPLEVKYGFTYKCIGISVTGGINSQYIFKQQAELDLIKEHVTNTLVYKDLDLNKISFAGILGVSVDVKLTNRLSLFIEPNGRMNFTKISKSSTVKSTPYFLGANTGLAFHF